MRCSNPNCSAPVYKDGLCRVDLIRQPEVVPDEVFDVFAAPVDEDEEGDCDD